MAPALLPLMIQLCTIVPPAALALLKRPPPWPDEPLGAGRHVADHGAVGQGERSPVVVNAASRASRESCCCPNEGAVRQRGRAAAEA